MSHSSDSVTVTFPTEPHMAETACAGVSLARLERPRPYARILTTSSFRDCPLPLPLFLSLPLPSVVPMSMG